MEHRVGALMVCQKDDGTNIAGIVTERDYLRKVIVRGRQSSKTNVAEIMTPRASLAVASPESTLQDCFALMRERQCRHLPVLADDDLVAMLSQRELVVEFEAYHDAQIKYLQEYIDFEVW